MAKLKNKIKKRKIEYEQEETVVSEEPGIGSIVHVHATQFISGKTEYFEVRLSKG